MKARCTNMNHGRLNAQIRYCPSCGESINLSVKNKCDHTKHLALRKAQDHYCYCCGADLLKLNS